MRKTMPRTLILIILICVMRIQSLAQCEAGYTQSQLNWDFLDYLVTSGTYSGYVTPAMANTQYFMMGTTRTTIQATAPAFTLGGENATHTGNLANYDGQDVQFTPTVNGDSMVITFSQPVMNVSFALYDLDRTAAIAVSARNASGAALNPSVTLQASTILTVAGVPTLVTVTSTNTGSGASSNT